MSRKKISFEYRLCVSWIGSIIGLFERLVNVLTFCYLPRKGWSLHYMFRAMKFVHRRERAKKDRAATEGSAS